MTIYTTRPDDWWPETHTAIYADGEHCQSVPHGEEKEAIRQMKASEEDYYQRIYDRLQSNDPRLVIADRHVYTIGKETDYPRGFGGQRWVIQFHDGREEITVSLWHQGKVPAQWAEKLPDNARVL